MNDEKKNPEQDPEIEVELEEDEDEEPDYCIQSDDESPDCRQCRYADDCDMKGKPAEPTETEPASPQLVIPIHIDSSVLPDISNRAGQKVTMQIHADRLAEAIVGIIRTVEINPTKNLEFCTAGYIYARLVSIKRPFDARETIELLAEVLEVFAELKKSGIISRETTPPGTLIN